LTLSYIYFAKIVIAQRYR